MPVYTTPNTWYNATMADLRATWIKPDAQRVSVDIIAFMALNVAETLSTRPVAIVADPTDSNRLRWVELKFLELEAL